MRGTQQLCGVGCCDSAEYITLAWACQYDGGC